MILIFVLLVECLVFVWALQRSGIMLFPHGFMGYIIGAQVFLWLNATGLVYYDFLQLWTSGAYETHLTQMVLMTFAFYLGAAACVPSMRVDLRSILANIHFKGDTDTLNTMIVVFLYLRLLLHWAYLDWGTAWYSSQYLVMSSPEGQGTIGTLLTQTARVFGVIAVIQATYLASKGRWGLFFAVLPLVLWHVGFDLAAHSRRVVYYFATAALTLMVLRPRRFVGPAILFLAAFVALLGSLAGRGSQHHGFSSLPNYLANIFAYPIELGQLTNIFEGIFVTAEYFGKPLEYPTIYKVLALSPLFSFIDGYDAVRLQHQIRVFAFVPHSAVTEVLNFGVVYAVVFFTVQFLAGWLSARLLARDQSLPALFVNSLVLLAMYLQFTYSARTVFRFFVVAVVASGVMWLYSVHRSSKKPVGAQAKRGDSPAEPDSEEVDWSAPKKRRQARAQEEGSAPRRRKLADLPRPGRFSRRAPTS